MEIDLDIEDPRWEALGLEALLAPAVAAVAAQLQAESEVWEISVLGCDDARIAALNADFRDKPTPTNVLSWPAEAVTPPSLPSPDFEGQIGLGDIAISFDTCAREADEQGKPIKAHVTHLIVHATLHLLGYDHQSDIEATLMEGLETVILGKLGLPDPYT